MFDSLSDRLGDVFERLRRHGALSEADVDTAMREVRVALLEADVALPVVKSFVKQVKTKAIGQDVLKGVNPAQMVIKIVHDHLIEMLGAENAELDYNAVPPIPILIVGLQGSGKTTSAAKLAKRMTEVDRKKVLLASLDVYRPAAQQQLAVLGEKIGVDTLPIVDGQMPRDIAKRAMDVGRLRGFDAVILDTAGRLHVDAQLMDEVADVADLVTPKETLLVVDSLTGQDAVNVATAFQERVKLSGVVLTRVDGDARGGAALSMRAVTGRPIKFIGTGEKPEAFEPFHPDRIAQRILGMGDIVSLVEKAQATVEEAEAERMAKKFAKGQFDLDDMAMQLKQLRKMGGLGGLMNLLPGVAKAKKQMADANVDEKTIVHQEAILSSMTPLERRNPKLLNASRKKRIAAGSGTSVPEVNKILKQYMMMADMMKKVRKMNKKGKFDMGALMGGQMPPGMGGLPPGGMPDLSQLPPELAKGAPGGGLPGLGGGAGGLPGLGGPTPGGLPGLGGPKKG